MSQHRRGKSTLVDKNPLINLARIKVQLEKGLRECMLNKKKRDSMITESGLQANLQNRWWVLLNLLFLSENLILQKNLIWAWAIPLLLNIWGACNQPAPHSSINNWAKNRALFINLMLVLWLHKRKKVIKKSVRWSH